MTNETVTLPINVTLGYKELWQLRIKNNTEELKFILEEWLSKGACVLAGKKVLRDFQQM